MKLIHIIIPLIAASTILSGCPAPTAAPQREYPKAEESNDSYGNREEPKKEEPKSEAAYNTPNDTLRNLKAGILPDPSLTKEEEKLIGILARKVKPEFPLKIGVLLYSNNSNLEDKYRKKFYADFLEKIKNNKSVGQIVEISNGLVTSGANIEEIRKLGARFQVSMILVINDQYLNPSENKESVVTPIDILIGTRTWESYSNVEIYALDVLNGVFVFSTSKGYRKNEKYSLDNTIQNKDRILIKESAQKAWKIISDNVDNEINDFKKRINKVT